MMRSIKKALLLTAGAGALVTGHAIYAQNAAAQEAGSLEEVVVTAERRAQDVQRTAASVSVRNGDELAEQGRYTLADILQTVPGVAGGAQTTPGAGGGSGTDSPASGVVIRGIVSNVGAGGTITSTAPSAATYVDGVYQGIGGNYDIGRVEVLRGPQGTLYGRSAVSGAVVTYTHDPDLDKFGGFANAEVGGNDAGGGRLRHYSGALNIPVIDDQLAIRLSANRYSQGGQWTNLSGGAGLPFQAQSPGASQQGAAKLKILYKPSDKLSVLVGGAYENDQLSSGSSGTTITQPSPDNVVVTRSPIVTFYPGHNKAQELYAKLDWDLGFGRLTYQPAYRNFKSNQVVAPTSTTCLAHHTTAELVALASICFYQPAITPFDEFITHEVRLASDPSSKITWQAGFMYYLNNEQDHADNEYINPVDNQTAWSDNCLYNPPGQCGNTQYIQYANNLKRTTQLGEFAEATYPITDALRLTGGLRYDHTRVQHQEFFYAHGNAVCLGGANLFVNLGATDAAGQNCKVLADDGVRTFNNLTWKARLEYDLTPKNMVYTTVSTGASPGDVVLSQDANGVPSVLNLKSETLTSYDIGSKNRFFDDKLQLNAEIYYQNYGGYQFANVNVGVREPLFTTVVIPVRFDGLDFEGLYQLTTDDRLGLNVGYTNGWYIGQGNILYTIPASAFGPTTNVTLGEFEYYKSVWGVVPWVVMGNYDHRFNLASGAKVNFHGDVRWTSGYQPGQLTKNNVVVQGVAPYAYVSPAYIFNTNVTWTSAGGHLSVSGYVRNLFDNRYKTGGNNGCNAIVPVCSGVTAAAVYSPLTWGAVANVNF